MSTAQSTSQTVTFRGVDGLNLIGDEWNPGAAPAATSGPGAAPAATSGPGAAPAATSGPGAAPAATSGPEGRPTILMLHGGGQNRYSWKNTGQILADTGFHVIALDSRGHGDSDRSPTADYTVESMCSDILQVLYQIGRPVVLVGASMGGLTGILAAHEAGPELVTRLVLVDVVPRFEKDGSARIRDFMFGNIEGFDSLDAAADAVAAYLPHRPKPRSPEGLKKNLRLRDGRWYWHWDPAFLTKPADDPFLRVDKMEQAAMNLEIPLLLIRGKLSDVVSPESVEDFLTKVPRAEFVELADAGHTAAGDDNDAFTDVVVRFVNQ